MLVMMSWSYSKRNYNHAAVRAILYNCHTIQLDFEICQLTCCTILHYKGSCPASAEYQAERFLDAFTIIWTEHEKRALHEARHENYLGVVVRDV